MTPEKSPKGKPVRKHATFSVDVWWCEDDTVEARTSGEQGPELFFGTAFLMATTAWSYKGGFEAGIEALTNWAMRAKS